MAWLSVGLRLRQNMGALPAGFSMMIAAGLCFIAGFSMSLELFLGAVPFIVAGLVGTVWSDQLMIGLSTRYGENGTYRIRGVHPDYLARVPAYNESDATGVGDRL